MFNNTHQKEISGIVTYLWKNDKAQGKWAILAKAYSIIRDAQGKELSPVEVFLEITVPLVKVPMPSQYLRAMGWEIGLAGSQLNLVQEETSIGHEYLETEHSVHSIVKHCIDEGYVVVQNLSQIHFDLMMVTAGGTLIPNDWCSPFNQVPSQAIIRSFRSTFQKERRHSRTSRTPARPDSILTSNGLALLMISASLSKRSRKTSSSAPTNGVSSVRGRSTHQPRT